MSGSFGPSSSGGTTNLSSPTPIGNTTPNSVFSTDLSNTGKIVSIPGSTQTLVATSSIACTSSIVPITSASVITLTSNPQLATGLNGQKVTLVNVGSNAITLVVGNGLLMPSNIILYGGKAVSFTYLTAYTSWLADVLVPESIALTGTPTSTTATSGTSSNQIATTAFVEGNVSPTWTAFTFQNSFADIGTPFQTCRYTKIRGIVYLQGSFTRNTAGFTTGMIFTTLPVGFRPTATLRHSSDSFYGAPSLIDIDLSGNMYLHYSGSPTNIITNVNQIRFPAS